MINKTHRNRNRFIDVMLVVVAISLLAASIYSVYLAWRTGLEQSRGETASSLMAVRTPQRPTETPGINAWVTWSLINSVANLESTIQNRFRQLVLPNSEKGVPAELQPLLRVLKEPPPKTTSSIEFKDNAIDGNLDSGKLQFRTVEIVENDGEQLVITSRNADDVQANIKQFAEISSAQLIVMKRAWESNSDLPDLKEFPLIRDARVARFYVLDESGTLISLPVAEADEVSSNLLRSEYDEFHKNPLSPSFVSDSFFFRFRFDQSLQNQQAYSGFYLDLGGNGLVASVTTPIVINDKRCVLGADVAFDVDWQAFMRGQTGDVTSQVVEVDKPADAWSPWSEFNANLPDPAHRMREATAEIASREAISSSTSRKSVYIATTRADENLLAIQVDRSTWLLLMIGPSEVHLPWGLMLLTSVVFLSLLVRIEWSRRQAVDAREHAREEMNEKQNLLDTMQVPLMVVDPNTDELIFCNNAAQQIGMRQGMNFGRDIVALDEHSQTQYRRRQTLGEEHRRAYGVSIRVGQADSQANSQSVRHAIVRSVAVTAPIESLRADQRHRLGILFLVDEALDLQTLLNSRIEDVRLNEKRLLAGLLNHGIDSLARVLASQLTNDDAAGNESFDHGSKLHSWLASYLSERIQLLSWVLENWNQTPIATEHTMIEKDTFSTTMDNWNRVIGLAAEDRHLRERLHWNNGLIAKSNERDVECSAIHTELDWDSDTCFAVPREGVFGFLLSEAIVNAVRHGKPGSRIECKVVQRRARNDLVFEFSNEFGNQSLEMADASKPFGGLVIIQELARLCGWEKPQVTCENNQFRVEIIVPTIRRKSAASGD